MKTLARRAAPFALVLLLVLAASPAMAQLIRVPQDVGTLQAAIGQVQDGGTIELAAGTYAAPSNSFRISNPGRSFTIRAAAGAQVILDGQGDRPVFRFQNGNRSRGGRIVFQGLSFRNGVTDTESFGGGMTLSAAEATFRDCEFLNNHSAAPTTGGGGVRVGEDSEAVFIDTLFRDNTAVNRGGAIAVVGSVAYALGSEFRDNRVDLDSGQPIAIGGGIYVLDAKLRVWDSHFEGNVAGWVGGAIYAFGTWSEPLAVAAADVLVTTSTFDSNRADDNACCNAPGETSGGAIHVEDHVKLRVYNSRFENNDAERGGALNIYRAAVEVRESVFRGNLATGSAAQVGVGGTIFVTSNDFVDSSTEFGAINRPSASTTITDSLIQGRFGGVGVAAINGGCINAAGDRSRMFGLAGITPEGSLETNRSELVLRRTVLADCDVERGPTGGTGLGGALNLNLIDLTMTDSMIFDSDAEDGGGAITAQGQSRVGISGSTLARNTANRGAGIFVNGSTLQIDDSMFVANDVSPGVAENIQTSRGAGIFSIPNAGATPLEAADVDGTVQNTVFSANVGLPIFEVDLDDGPINAVRYGGNTFFSTTFGNNVFVNILADRMGESVGELNNLVINRANGTSTSKSLGGNAASGVAPARGQLLSVPSTLHRIGPALAQQSAFLGFAWSGNNGTLNGQGLGDRAGLRDRAAAGTSTLQADGTAVDTAVTGASSCTGGPILCLNDDRFRVEANWEDFQGNTGGGEAVALSTDTGYFFFFSPSNVELVAKVLDGRALNNRFWFFYGALSNVEYEATVVDTQTGRINSYFNPSRNFASVGDTRAFPANTIAQPGAFQLAPLAELSEPAVPAVPEKANCTPDATSLCLNQGRFRVQVEWRDFQNNTGVGMAEPLTGDTGYFWFFNEENVEVILKVLDGRALTNHFWVFYGALSNVEYTITVTDTDTGDSKTYFNPLRNFASVGDTRALPGE